MMVTTCGADRNLSELTRGAFGGSAGLFGDGAGVCATATAPKSSALTMHPTGLIFLTAIFLILTFRGSAF